MAWYGEELRHSKAAMGIKTGRKDRTSKKLNFQEHAGRIESEDSTPRVFPRAPAGLAVRPSGVGVTIRNNTDVAEAFAAGATMGKRKSIFIEGNAIYSYGRHFPIAVIIGQYDEHGNPRALFNKDRYSVTTAKHKSQVRSALVGKGYVLTEKTTEELQEVIRRS